MADSRKILPPYHSVTAGDMSADIISAVTNILYQDNIGVELDFTGTPNGTFTIEVSNSYLLGTGGTVLNAGTWTALNIQPAPTATGAAGSFYLDLNQLGAAYLRVHYTAVSGSGTLDVYVTGKALG